MLLIDILIDLIGDELVFDLFKQGFFLSDFLFQLCCLSLNTCKPLF